MKKKISNISMILFITLFITSCTVPKKVMINNAEKVTENIQNKSDINSNFIKANEWMVQTFNNAKSVIQFKDKEAGIVKGKYLLKDGISGQYGQSIPAMFSIITIRVKDNASRIEIDPPSGLYSQKYMGKEYGFTNEDFLAAASVLTESFKKYMIKKSENDNW